MMKYFRAISLGWGVQSFTLAAMVALGELEPVDVAVHADTTHERSQTYEFAERWTPWLEAHGVKVVKVQADNTEPINKHGGVMLPAYMRKEDKLAQFSRQCTDNWKRVPLRRYLQAHRNGTPVEMWLGISYDEYRRMKDSDVKYITNRYPLIEMKMTRDNCETWLSARDLEVPVKSSCVFCPYHNMAAWRELKQSGNGDWDKAVQVDEMIRKACPPYDLFVHQAREPLAEIDLRTPQEKGKLELWANWDNECSGMCGV